MESSSSSSRRSISPSSLTRHTSPTRVRISSPSIRFSSSPTRSISATRKPLPTNQHKKTCMCSPTTHPGSFRCSLHKNTNNKTQVPNSTIQYQSNRLYARRSAMTNSLVRIGTVEGDLVRRALAALIRPSSHQQRRRNDFQARPSRLSVMSKA